MHTISVNMSALPHCQVEDKQEWSDNRYYIILGIATLPTVTVSVKIFLHLILHTDISDNEINKCMSWRFITWYIQNSARQPLWDSGAVRRQAPEMSMWCYSKNTDRFVIFCHLKMRCIPTGCWHSWTEWQNLCFTTVTVPPYKHNVTFCASQQLLFPLTNIMSHFILHNSYCSPLPTQCHILCFTIVTVLFTNTMSHFMLHNSYSSSLPTQCHILCFITVTVPSYQHNVTFYASQQLLFPLTNTMSHFLLHNIYCSPLPT